MAGGNGKDVFPKTPVDMKDVLSAEDVRKAEMMQRILDAMNAYDIEERSFLAREVTSIKKWMHCSGWKRQEVSDEFMLEFVKVTRKKNRLRGQQQRRTTLRKSLENDRKFLEKSIFLDRTMKADKMKLIDLKIRRNVLIAEKKHRQIVKCMQRLGVLYSRLRGRPAPWACVN